MTCRFPTTNISPRELLRDCLDKRVPLIVSYRHDEGWNVFKATLLAVHDEADEATLEYPGASQGAVPELMPGQMIGIAFRKGHKKCLGDTFIIERCCSNVGGQSVPAFRVRLPNELYELQRRLFYRVPVPEHMTIPVTLWHGLAEDRPEGDEGVLTGAMIDLSAGGLAMVLDTPPAALDDTSTLGCAFHDNGQEYVLSSQVRYIDPNQQGQTRLGLQFIGADASPEGRARLEQIVGMLSRMRKTH